jgi:hypothetical protein
MNRMFRAGLLALPLLLAGGQSAPAVDPPGFAGTRWGCYQHGCGGFCFQIFPHMHQHGPLVNYGPYTGYYPFAPYGPWDENLRYNGPGYGNGLCGGCGRHGCGGRCGGGLLGRLRGDDGNCGGWGGYARSLFANIGRRVDPLCGQHGVKAACSTCSN